MGFDDVGLGKRSSKRRTDVAAFSSRPVQDATTRSEAFKGRQKLVDTGLLGPVKYGLATENRDDRRALGTKDPVDEHRLKFETHRLAKANLLACQPREILAGGSDQRTDGRATQWRYKLFTSGDIGKKAGRVVGRKDDDGVELVRAGQLVEGRS